ncbi:hypothetical protein FL583_22495 [Cryptosporangium phraense]|uniref:Protein involved in plasmid replication-relaxation n=1 Tax=Cryptosporangium phraense TaxID=2593070 RepID=A0A545AQ96_9ACTN|nr:hypothetical protein FL583_22495 [Cryptosporangium phraense]
MDWLAEHYLLSTAQITQALFPSPRTARLRLKTLHDFGALERFADITTGTNQHLYALGPVGLLVAPTQWNDPDRPQSRPLRSSAERTARIAASRTLRHLLGTNQFFVDLLAHARAHPDAHLQRWWSEQHATASWTLAGIRPDGHGVWTAQGRTVGFFLEHDNGTEPLGTVLGKLRAYSRLAAVGPRYPVLLRVPGPVREAHLLDALTDIPTPMPVATSTHDRHPAVAAWLLAADPSRRRALHELPSDHGPDDPPINPHRYQPTDGRPTA